MSVTANHSLSSSWSFEESASLLEGVLQKAEMVDVLLLHDGLDIVAEIIL